MKQYQALTSDDPLTTLVRELGIVNWLDLIHYIKKLPYGRNKNRFDFSLVLTEQKGTCSSKHALLKTIADRNHINDLKLTLGIYKMNTQNTNNLHHVLTYYQLDYIPEAHCYLKTSDTTIDCTSIDADFNRIQDDILLEKDIQPRQVNQFKIAFHKEYLRNWIKEKNIPYSFEEIWNIREKCIEALENIPE